MMMQNPGLRVAVEFRAGKHLPQRLAEVLLGYARPVVLGNNLVFARVLVQFLYADRDVGQYARLLACVERVCHVFVDNGRERAGFARKAQHLLVLLEKLGY